MSDSVILAPAGQRHVSYPLAQDARELAIGRHRPGPVNNDHDPTPT
jgi:hypothetical protein